MGEREKGRGNRDGSDRGWVERRKEGRKEGWVWRKGGEEARVRAGGREVE